MKGLRYLSLLIGLGTAGIAAPVEAQTALVFAAASLKDALDEQAKAFEGGGPYKVSISYAASSTLAKQIENGAPVDLFVSADLDWMNYLASRGLIDPGSRTNLVSNRLVLIAPADSLVKAVVAPGFPLRTLLGGGRLAVADPDHVPAGKYARAALESLGVWNSVSGHTARADNVRAALALVSRGEAPLGIVYRTDALSDPRVRIVAEFPERTHTPIVYPAALTSVSRSPAGPRLLDYLKSAAARAVWKKYGFAPRE